LGGPNRSIKTPASIAMRVIGARNPLNHGKVTAHAGVGGGLGLYKTIYLDRSVFVSHTCIFIALNMVTLLQ